MSPSARIRNRAACKRWRAKNKDYIREYNREYKDSLNGITAQIKSAIRTNAKRRGN